MLREKAPALSDKELNPDFFHNYETRGSCDLTVEVVDKSNEQKTQTSEKNNTNIVASSSTGPEPGLMNSTYKSTLEATRVAGEDDGASRGARVAIPELTAQALAAELNALENDPVWTSWSNAMDALHVGEIDLAFGEVLSIGDELLLLKLMGISGPVIDQLSNETANETLHAVSQFLLDRNLMEINLSWVQQLIDIAVENGPDALETAVELKREILLNLKNAASSIDPSEEWEGATPDQLLMQLASAWEIDIQDLEK